MLAGKRVIGVCVTKIHERARAEVIQRLFKAASAVDTKLIVFNSVVDFYKPEACESGAKAIYNMMNYDILDGIIVFAEHFYNGAIMEDILEDAKSHGVPVVVVEREIPGCYCVMRDYTDAYKSLMRHVICEHGITDTFYIAGRTEGDIESEIRIRCYKEVLEECGISYSDNNVAYGEYWNMPTYKVVDDLLKERGRPPRAIFCANDSMAIAVCEYLSKNGYTVPDDVIVTGFDGIPDAMYFNPRLSTCVEDTDHLVALCLSIIDKHYTEDLPCGTFTERYKACYAESCGCKRSGRTAIEDASHLFNMMQNSDSHERYMYTWVDRMIDCDNLERLADLTHGCLLMDSFLCVKSSLFSSDAHINNTLSLSPDDTLAVIPSELNNDNIEMYSCFNGSSIIPDAENWLNEDKIYVLSSIYAGVEACGYYAVKTNEIDIGANHLNRMCKILNISFNSTMKTIRQNALRRRIENASLINQYTGLPNLRGLSKWFEEFSAVPENHERALSVSIYGLPNYRYIYENYGIRDVEEALNHIAAMLMHANQKDCYIAHISQEEFIVVNYYNDVNDIGDTINKATSVFFAEQGQYNSNSGKDYFVEVNCGCTVAKPYWDETLSTFISLASGEMYINRVKMGVVDVEKDKVAPVENYNAFRTLIDKNMFSYHFQPIIDASTGEIYAYEALMRTDPRIGMNPFEVLEIAQAYKRLYDVERATVFNVMERYANEQDSFRGRKVFINSIPGYILRDADELMVREKYGDLMKNVVFEITEQNSVSDEELSAIKTVGNPYGNNHIAIDDYGTGHSNIVNLLRYQPQIIKIDRFLISDIDKDVNKQMFVRSTIDFARLNDIKVLAEGVETSEELRTVIDFGVDYVQGYYTGRPAPEPIADISPELKKEFER